MIVPLPFGALRGGMQRDRFFGDAAAHCRPGRAIRPVRSPQHVLAAEAVRIRALLDFVSGKTGGDDSRARLHFHLMNHGADARDEKLLDAAKRHRAFGHRDAFHAAHFLVGGQQQIDLALDGNAERIFEKRILPGVDVSLFGRERYVRASQAPRLWRWRRLRRRRPGRLRA